MVRWQFGCDFQAWVLRTDKDTRRNMAARNDPDQGVDAQGGGVQSVDRALQILDILAREGDAGVSEIAEEIGRPQIHSIPPWSGPCWVVNWSARTANAASTGWALESCDWHRPCQAD